MADEPTQAEAEATAALTVRGPDGRSWPLALLIALAVLSLVAAGTTVGWTLTQREKQVNAAQEDVQQNRDVLVALCSSMTTLRFVFEQLELLDHRLAREPSLAVPVRAELRARATLYATGVVALSDIRECRGIE